MGLDVGDRRIGVALSDPLGLTAGRLMTLERRSLQADLERISSLVTRQAVEVIVVGLPLTLQGTRGLAAQKVEAFSEALRRRVTVPVVLVDERLTTVQGERALVETGASRRRRKAVVDQVAAQLILQQFLDVQRRPPTA